MSMIITMFLVDVWGRRPMTVYGYLVTVLADFGMGATGFRNVSKSPALGGLLVFFACLATFSTTSASAIGYAYLAEIPKQDLRAKSAGWGLAISNLFSTMVRVQPYLTLRLTHSVLILCTPYDRWISRMGRQDRLVLWLHRSHRRYRCVVHPARGHSQDTG